ncbi:DHH family phosphoesterase [Methanoregula formicica]|uniref:Putative DHD superfamily phosphohydrolase n=1 Tax=Methanoregula formicica (strain DSM 22288 / NBRC 105244 / SMSP) TaxID=593750 RepID=L0HGV8_METFS|nr:DHD superfamily phosphohydrolase [Methanoregula formicica]AGB02304.1 putative DHD superfamily phosphohydrolase [Methanoregula formicica SMSP]
MASPNRSEDSGLTNAIKSRAGHVVHVTHNDLDAVGADAVHRMKFGNEGVFTIWCSVGKFAALFSLVASCDGKGDLLSISDLGFHPDAESIAVKAKKNGWVVEWRDHHRWREEEIEKIGRAVSLLRVDTSTCGTGIVARDLMPGDPVAAEVARVVCDYDLWKHADPRSAVLGQVLQRKENRDHVRNCLINGIFTDEQIEREYADIRNEMESMMKHSLRQATFTGTKYRIAFAPLYGYPSETAHFIRDEKKTEIEVIIGKDGKFSIRSVPPISHLIAREFGGGGHPSAAGGSFHFTVVERFTWWLFKKSRHFDELVKVAEKF